MKKMNLLLLLIFCVLSCTVKIENPKILFDELNLKYSSSNPDTKKVESQLDDGMGITIYDKDHKLSNDILCNLALYSTMGQTNFLCYCKEKSKIWYIEETTRIYNSPYSLDDLYLNEKYYYQYSNGKTKMYNLNTKKYDLNQEPSDFEAVPNVDNIEYVIQTILKNN